MLFINPCKCFLSFTVFPLTDPSDNSQNESQMDDPFDEISTPVTAPAKKPAPKITPTPKRTPGRPKKKPEPEEPSTSGANNMAASAVKKMRSLLSPKKLKERGKHVVHPNDALIHVIQPEEVDDYVHDAEDEDFSPMASTIIIVKPNSDDHPVTLTPALPKKEVLRVKTMTMSSGRQYVVKNKKGKKDAVAEADKEAANNSLSQEDATDVEEFLNELRDKTSIEAEAKERKSASPERKARGRGRGRPAKEKEEDEEEDEDEEDLIKGKSPSGKKGNTLHQRWKSLGVEGEQLGSGDVVITAEDLKNATESVSVGFNETEYNFEDGNTPEPKKKPTRGLSYSEKKPKINVEIPVQKVQCMVCGKTLLNYSYLYRHVRHYHKDIQDVDQYLDEIRPLMKTPCPLCGKEISSISNMSSHIQQCHPSSAEPYKCEECGGFYKTRISLKHHMQSQHTPGRKKFPCKYCGSMFTESRSLREHVNCTHETTEVFSCEVCKKTFLTRGRLRRHMYIHGEFRLFCKYCGKGFHLKDNMNKHIELMHEKKNSNRFKCEYCSKAFNVKGNLMQHINGVHLKTLPYRCPICDQGFRKKGHMLSHMKDHAVKKQEYGEDVEGVEVHEEMEDHSGDEHMEEEEEDGLSGAEEGEMEEEEEDDGEERPLEQVVNIAL